MKRFNLFFFALIASLLTFTSCDDDSDNNSTSDVVLSSGDDLPASVGVGSTLTLPADGNYNLTQALRVSGTLIIEEGVTITASGTSATSLFIVIQQNAKIMAEGTASKPIVMTAATKEPSSWGGLIIAGNAPINKGTTATTEIGDSEYGGTDVNDNSGIIRYLRTEYTGAQINSEKQHNGITFYGVGAGTTVEYIQAYMGGDDGIEMFGGTVNLNYVVSTGSQDDQFDFAEGYVGTVNYLYTEQVNDATYQQDRGIEGDNLGSDNDATPFSSPTIKNFTLVGYSVARNADNETTDGMRIREGAKGSFENFKIMNYSDEGVDIRSLQTLINFDNGDLSFSTWSITGFGDKSWDAKVDDGETDTDNIIDDVKANSATNGTATGADADPSTTKFYAQSWVKSL